MARRSKAREDSANALLPAFEAGRGLFSRLQTTARRLPGADFAAEALNTLEGVAMRELKSRLESLDAQEPAAEDTAPSLAKRVHPQLLLAALLDEGKTQGREQALRTAYTAALLELTPDEAMLLAALCDGSSYPLVHVTTAPKLGSGEPVSGYISTIARRALVRVREHVPRHLRHLEALGLVEIGPEDRDEDIAYQTLEGSAEVRGLMRTHKARGRNLRCQRRTLRISDFGAELWAACGPQAETD